MARRVKEGDGLAVDLDGVGADVLRDTAGLAGDDVRLADGGWLEAELKRRSLTAEQVLLMTIDAAGTVYLVRKEDLA